MSQELDGNLFVIIIELLCQVDVSKASSTQFA